MKSRVGKRAQPRFPRETVSAAGQRPADFSKGGGPETHICEGCFTERDEYESYGPTCLRCPTLEPDFVRPSGDQETLRADANVIVKTEDGLSEQGIILKREYELLDIADFPLTEDGTLEMKATVKTEDGLRLRTSQAQSTLDDSLTRPNSICNTVTGYNIMSTQANALQPQNPAGRRPNCRSLHIDSVKVLSWPVFAGQFGPQAEAMAVLPQKQLEHPQPSASDLDRFLSDPEVGDRLVMSFIDYVHVKNPILDVTNLRSRAFTVYLEGIGWNSESCLMLLVWALGAMANSFSTPASCHYDRARRELGSALFRMASKRLGAVLADGGILPAQCFFYAGVYLLFTLQPASAWRHFLQALAYCQELDVALHGARKTQAPMTASKSPHEELNLYWSCWKAEMQLRLCLGVFDFQTQDRVPTESLPDVAVNHCVEVKVRLFYLADIAIMKLAARARNDIGRILSSFSGGNNGNLEAHLMNAVVSYDQEGKNWLTSLPPDIAIDMSQSGFDIYRFTLGCRLLDFEELISWTFLEDAINSGEVTLPKHVHHYAKGGIRVCMNRIRLAVIGQKYRDEGTWLLLQSCARSVIVLVAASLSHHARSLLPEGWICLVDSGIHVLRQWMEEDAGIRSQVRALEDLRELQELRKRLGCI